MTRTFLPTPTPFSTAFAPDGNGRPLSTTRQRRRNILQLDTERPAQLGDTTRQACACARGMTSAAFLKTYTPPTLGGTDEKTTFSLDLDRYLQRVDSPVGMICESHHRSRERPNHLHSSWSSEYRVQLLWRAR